MMNNYSKKLIGLLGAALMPFLHVSAAHISPQQALQRVERANTGSMMSRGATFRLAYSETVDGQEAVYVFNNGDKGFIVTSADDRLPALLGYSDNGAFNIATAAPALKWWLSQYAAEADYYFKNESNYTFLESRTASRSDIPEMLKTRWNQDNPYNLDCPTDAGGRSVTGCVATAMAQVIKYHQYPTNGTGTHSYTWNGKTLSFDYGSATFDYANMLNEYGSKISSTTTQDKAVANLMYACGVGVNMSYSSNESGAGSMYIPYALKTFFNYDKGVRLLERVYFSTEEWEDMVYAELAAGRPVIYGGQAPSGGHEFVCDGYEDGLFHINWGWAGMGNGYFSLSALDPGLQGIGGFAGGYNSKQGAVFGLQPPTTGTTAWYPIYATGGLVANNVGNYQFGDPIGVALGANISFSNDGGIFNYSPEEITATFYIKAVSASDNQEYKGPGYKITFKGANGLSASGRGGFSMPIPANLPAGQYRATLVFETSEGNIQDVLIPRTASAYLDMTVDSNGNVSFTSGTPAEKATIEITKFEPDTDISANSTTTTRLNISIQNTGEIEYSGAIYAKAFAPGTETDPVWSSSVNISVAGGKTFDGYFSAEVSLNEGWYDVFFYDMYGDKVSSVFPLKVGNPETIAATEITLDQSTATMEEGETLTLTASVKPDNTSDKTVAWTTSDATVATVENGVVTAVKAGTVTITATCGKVSANCAITVTAKVIAVTGISLDKTEATIVEGDKLTLAATVDPETATDKTITWTSSNVDVATVDESGVVTAIKEGNATITAKCGEKTATCAVTVTAKAIPATGITLDKTEATILEGETLTFTATVEPENTTDNTITWNSSDEEVATVENGVVTAVKAGEATITATCGKVSATCEITVKAKVIAVTGISLDKTEATIVEGDKLTLAATVDPETATDKTITWTSSNVDVATVDESGVVTAIKEGNATITAKCGEKTATCAVTVTAKAIPATGITLDKTEAMIIEGETLTLTATVEPVNTTDNTVIWSSSDEDVATVENGVVSALKTGSATITATCDNVSATCTITVTAKVIAVTGVTLDKTDATIVEGETLTLTATVEPDDATDKTVTWTSSNEAVATVNENGVVTALTSGEATITAKCGDKSATCVITVTAKEIAVTGISLDKTDATIVEGETLTLTATVEPSDATDKTITWTSSNEAVATVDKNGGVTAVAPGEATITATCGEKTASCVVTVTAKVIAVTGISLDKTEATIVEGETLMLTATVEPDDATDKTVTWTSSDEAVATVDKNGGVTAVAPGEATITATCGEKTATCVVTVSKKLEFEPVNDEDAGIKITGGVPNNDGSLTIPSTVTVGGEELPVVEIGKEAFSGSEVKTVIIPESVVTIGAGAFENCAKLVTVVISNLVQAIGNNAFGGSNVIKQIEYMAEELVEADENVFDAEAYANAILYVRAPKALSRSESANELEIAPWFNFKNVEYVTFTMNKEEAEVMIGRTLKLEAELSHELPSNPTISWTSSDEAVATVDENGEVTAIATGEATITATTTNGLTAVCVVSVPETVIATSITLNTTSIAAIPGTSITLSATVLPDAATDKTVKWTSSDATIATVDENGRVTIHSTGNAVITASTVDGSNLSASCAVVGLSGIETLIMDAGNADIYTISGHLLKRGAEASFITTLPKGIYIVRIGNHAYKVVK